MKKRNPLFDKNATPQERKVAAIVFVIVFALISFVFITSQLSSPTPSPSSQPKELSTNDTVIPDVEEDEPVTSQPKPETPQVEEKEADDSVTEVEELYFSMLGFEDPMDALEQEGYEPIAPFYAIQRGWTGSKNGYIRINVQETLNTETTKRLCIQIMNFVGPEYRDLSGIVFTDSQGIDHNCFRSEAPGADWG